jgi:hypothetical protein
VVVYAGYALVSSSDRRNIICSAREASTRFGPTGRESAISVS